MYNIEDDFFYDCEQKFYIINKQRWDVLTKMEQIDGVSFCKSALINNVITLLEFAEQHEDFCCALTKVSIGKMKFFWFPMLFYNTSAGWIRVRVETTKCLICDWQGNIANPTLPDLYDTVTERFIKMKRGYEIPTVPCPNCGLKLDRYAIWIEK